jgi:hypothetical protein
MLTVKSLNPDKRLAVTIAVFFAEDALSFWEAEFPENMRPRKAIEAAKEWLANPCEETVDAANAAYAANAAAAATTAAANAAAQCSFYVHNKLVQLLPHLLEYKIYIKTSFEDPEQVFDLLSKQNQQRFLFNLDRLR